MTLLYDPHLIPFQKEIDSLLTLNHPYAWPPGNFGVRASLCLSALSLSLVEGTPDTAVKGTRCTESLC